MVATGQHHLGSGLAKLEQDCVEQFYGLRRRRRGVEDVAGRYNDLHTAHPHLLHHGVEHTLERREGGVTVECSADVPVRSVQNAHAWNARGRV